MTRIAQDELGTAIQFYVRSRRVERSGCAAAESAQPLDPDLRERLDALGTDAERLLDVPAGEVVQTLRELERFAAIEDDAAAAAASRLRLREERGFHDGPGTDRRPGRQPPQQRRSAGQGGGRRRSGKG